MPTTAATTVCREPTVIQRFGPRFSLRGGVLIPDATVAGRRPAARAILFALILLLAGGCRGGDASGALVPDGAPERAGAPLPLAVGPLSLMPEPAQVELTAGSLLFGAALLVGYQGCSGGRIPGAVERFKERLASVASSPSSGRANGPALRLTIRCRASARLALDEDESYRLTVSKQGALVEAPTDLGVLHGLVTLAQLAGPPTKPTSGERAGGQTASGGPLAIPFGTLTDHPRYPWRGLLVDSARHFLPLRAIERTLDGMEEVKLNVLHWHLTDDQGFRAESRRFPLLAGRGSAGLFYTQEQLREVVAYADARGIRVVPEFDLPAHTTSWFVGYPDLAAAPGPYRLEHRFGVFDAVIDPTREQTYRFLAGFFSEMTGIFPDDYVHIGGDETTGVAWAGSPRIMASLRAHDRESRAALQGYFTRRLVAILSDLGRKAIGWNEILGPGLPDGTLIEAWTTPLAAFEASLAGRRCVLARGYYLDTMETAAAYYRRDPGPLAEGGEACMWGELVDGSNLDERVWPRAAAIAERLWSPASVVEVSDMYRRLDVESRRLARLGLAPKRGYDERLLGFLGSGARTDDLRRLTLFIDALRPLGLSGRMRARSYTTATPFDRVADIARPDSALVRELASEVADFLALRERGAGDAASDGLEAATGDERLRAILISLRDNDRALSPILRRSAALREVAPLSSLLAQAGSAALTAVDLLSSGRRPDREFCADSAALLRRAELPEGELSLAVVEPIAALFSAACGLGAADSSE